METLDPELVGVDRCEIWTNFDGSRSLENDVSGICSYTGPIISAPRNPDSPESSLPRNSRIYEFTETEVSDSECSDYSGSSTCSEKSEEQELVAELSVKTNGKRSYNPPTKLTRKRLCTPSNWEKNKVKKLCNSGQEYISRTTNQKVAARQVQPSCGPTCRFKCDTKVTDDQRQTIFDKYWVDGCALKICKKMFLSTLDISETSQLPSVFMTPCSVYMTK
ncbi:uncharacterized protein LOC124160483 [Ischnura elegans]|uniref:uncharacterized protein LOC124160483 n=1 Tax=Ischnura elegans TaxID=197161 RepID=UPI001ED86D9A|nr:uncharacterized protein LOC124160483 [Ischnura elegans]